MVDQSDDQNMSCKEEDLNASATSSGKIRIKFKRPIKSELSIEGEEEQVEQKEKQKPAADHNNNDSTPNSNPENNHRVCEFCDKVFSSGKALGGHMRIHVQHNNNNKKDKKPLHKKLHQPVFKKRTSVDSSRATALAGSKLHKCSLCGKEFPSLKSLFGHMRCHPDREWRGIQPPRNSTESSTLSDAVADKTSEEEEQQQQEEEEDQIDSSADSFKCYPVVDLKSRLPSWGMTGKRGRRAAAVTAPDGGADDFGSGLACEDEMHDAVRDLMMLAKSTPRDAGSSSKKKADVFGPNCNNSGEEKGKGKAKIEGGCVPHGSLKKESADTTDGEESDSRKTIASLVKKKYNAADGNLDISGKFRKQKKRRLRDLEKAGDVAEKSSTAVRYKCNTCNKTFQSHQALGGHRSSHNKYYNKNTATIPSVEESATRDVSTAAAEEDGSSHCQANAISGDTIPTNQLVKGTEAFVKIFGTKVVVTDGITHQCEICSMVFPTGQALEGHKRLHLTTNSAEGSSSHAASPGEASSQANRVARGFDLNEPPPAED